LKRLPKPNKHLNQNLKKKVAEFLGINSNQLYPSMKIIFMEKKLKNNRKT
jgi:hypothetical protein